MKLELYKTFWGFDGGPDDAAPLVRAAGFDGIEAPVPAQGAERERFARSIEALGMPLIAEITTAGSYVPERSATPDDHLRDLEAKIVWGKPLRPRFFNVMAGCDAWPAETQRAFFERAVGLAEKHDVVCSFETHRGRSFFNPWITAEVARAVPTLKLTCDFSHWVSVCERLLESEWDVIDALAPHAHHIHARVGYPQGPQVPHPAAPEYAACLASHQRMWEALWASQIARGYTVTTMTPEFGPDGYLHTLPFTNAPVADLWDVNTWMGREERRHLAQFLSERHAA
ncbi:sugar phosphate isomerase/epimerase family protein [Pararobbsia silviterrae]|uniref:Sugar phosphate isomerase/epimerase n=1 Tax=Pararobbsia silviterrae TaxID=1792498 RepID=A0A494XWB9_9BURK|nr:TIM barrel protein [Pararobbsia silviterrae]RKP54903.1 sugar phosphate isomerase/epimerase [Pararobbsia silviterrae]